MRISHRVFGLRLKGILVYIDNWHTGIEFRVLRQNAKRASAFKANDIIRFGKKESYLIW